MGKPPEVTLGPIDLGAICSLHNLPLWAPTFHLSEKPDSQIPVMEDSRGPPHLRKGASS